MKKEKTEKVFKSIWCEGPGTDWMQLTPDERLLWFLFKRGPFSMCGPSVVEMDMSNPDDIWPMYCPTCNTDTNWEYTHE